MIRLLVSSIISATLLLAFPWSVHGSAAAEALSPAEVVVLNPDMDGSVIAVEGEAIAYPLRAVGGGWWLNVLGDEVGLGLWTTEEMLEPIEYYGSYTDDGDQVRATGTLNMTCPVHGGEFDLHVEDLEVIEVGQPREADPVPLRGFVGLAGIAIGGGLWLRYRAQRD